MFRVIIADDENRIVKMLAASIPWTKLGLSVASFASDGMEALRLAEEKKADIIITDIRMPGLNGLELCEKLHEANPNIQIILISGYADFSYAQRAIQLGVLEMCIRDRIHSLRELVEAPVQETGQTVGLTAPEKQPVFNQSKVQETVQPKSLRPAADIIPYLFPQVRQP